MFVRAYLRASTSDQDANRAKGELESFAAGYGHKIAKRYTENESGAKLDRPKLFELLEDSSPGDVLLVEQIDRLSRMTDSDWKALRQVIKAKGINVVSIDLPTSHKFMTPPKAGDDFTQRVMEAINDLMLDILAATSRKDYEDRRRRQKQGIEKAKANGKFRGKQENPTRLKTIEGLIQSGQSYSEIVASLGCSRATVAKVAKRMKAAEL
jgi:DNA invertase Pin-like site-specific DNA recombinase